MFRKLGLSLFCTISLMANSSFAATTHVFSIGSGIDYELPVNEPQLFSNPFMWTIKAVCAIKSDDDDNFLSFKVTRKTGSLNGIKFSTGDSMKISLHAHEKMFITAAPGAEVELINIGTKVIRTECSIY
ncbi:MAG: hypothetical protein Q8R24_03525 [Legionellaceae bacterium]|nr:hypothetical protein [Legionellaceae bacterium]